MVSHLDIFDLEAFDKEVVKSKQGNGISNFKACAKTKIAIGGST